MSASFSDRSQSRVEPFDRMTPVGSSDKAQADVVLPAGVDLHARPAAEFVRTALAFKARIVIAFGEREADAKSLLAVLGLGAKAGSALSLRADGGDAGPAVEALRGCVAGLH